MTTFVQKGHPFSLKIVVESAPQPDAKMNLRENPGGNTFLSKHLLVQSKQKDVKYFQS